MAIVRFRPYGQAVDPFRDFDSVQSEMNRLFEGLLNRSPQVGGERVWAPAVDMHETQDELVISAELPGMSEKDIHLSITGEMITLRGERQWNQQEVPQGSFFRTERWFGKFERTLALPFPVQVDKVKASYRDGILTVKLPKAEEIKSREIKIDVL